MAYGPIVCGFIQFHPVSSSPPGFLGGVSDFVKNGDGILFPYPCIYVYILCIYVYMSYIHLYPGPCYISIIPPLIVRMWETQ